MTASIRAAAELTRVLPAADVERLSRAVELGATAVVELRGSAGSPQLRWACDSVLALGPSAQLAGVLRGAAAVRGEGSTSIDIVWGGPDSPAGGGRLTSAVITECLDDASETLLVVGYAVHDEPSVVAALHRAARRGVEITLLCERPVDNPRFQGVDRPFPDLPARRLAWPSAHRPPGSSLHAKILVVDRRVALVGSANLTGAALGRNLECGLLVMDGDVAGSIAEHVEGLLRAGHLRLV